MGHQIVLRRDGTAYVSGIDHETNRITVAARNKKAIVLRISGRSCWAGNYTPRAYASSELQVFRIISEKDSTLEVEPMIEVSLARKKKDE